MPHFQIWFVSITKDKIQIKLNRCFKSRPPSMHRNLRAILFGVLTSIFASLLLGGVSATYPGGRAGSATWYYENKLWLFGGMGMDGSSVGRAY
jgi:hypothetical protein